MSQILQDNAYFVKYGNDILARVRILHPLGQSNSTVYEAVDRRTGEAFALKEIVLQTQDEEKYVMEESAMLRHVSSTRNETSRYFIRFEDFCIVKICVNADCIHTVAYILMEKATMSLSQFISAREKLQQHKHLHRSNNRCLTTSESLFIIQECLTGLAYLQELHIGHSDIKPENILLILKDEGDIVDKSRTSSARLRLSKETTVVKICDIGSAVRHNNANSSVSMSASVGGTIPFLAPELVDKYLRRTTAAVPPPTLMNQMSASSATSSATNNKFNPFKSDAFSFGLCALYILTNTKFFKNLRVVIDGDAYEEQIRCWKAYALKLIGGHHLMISLLSASLQIKSEHRMDFISLQEMMKQLQVQKPAQRSLPTTQQAPPASSTMLVNIPTEPSTSSKPQSQPNLNLTKKITMVPSKKEPKKSPATTILPETQKKNTNAKTPSQANVIVLPALVKVAPSLTVKKKPKISLPIKLKSQSSGSTSNQIVPPKDSRSSARYSATTTTTMITASDFPSPLATQLPSLKLPKLPPNLQLIAEPPKVKSNNNISSTTAAAAATSISTTSVSTGRTRLKTPAKGTSRSSRPPSFLPDKQQYSATSSFNDTQLQSAVAIATTVMAVTVPVESILTTNKNYTTSAHNNPFSAFATAEPLPIIPNKLLHVLTNSIQAKEYTDHGQTLTNGQRELHQVKVVLYLDKLQASIDTLKALESTNHLTTILIYLDIYGNHNQGIHTNKRINTNNSNSPRKTSAIPYNKNQLGMPLFSAQSSTPTHNKLRELTYEPSRRCSTYGNGDMMVKTSSGSFLPPLNSLGSTNRPQTTFVIDESLEYKKKRCRTTSNPQKRRRNRQQLIENQQQLQQQQALLDSTASVTRQLSPLRGRSGVSRKSSRGSLNNRSTSSKTNRSIDASANNATIDNFYSSLSTCLSTLLGLSLEHLTIEITGSAMRMLLLNAKEKQNKVSTSITQIGQLESLSLKVICTDEKNEITSIPDSFVELIRNLIKSSSLTLQYVNVDQSYKSSDNSTRGNHHHHHHNNNNHHRHHHSTQEQSTPSLNLLQLIAEDLTELPQLMHASIDLSNNQQKGSYATIANILERSKRLHSLRLCLQQNGLTFIRNANNSTTYLDSNKSIFSRWTFPSQLKHLHLDYTNNALGEGIALLGKYLVQQCAQLENVSLCIRQNRNVSTENIVFFLGCLKGLKRLINFSLDVSRNLNLDDQLLWSVDNIEDISSWICRQISLNIKNPGIGMQSIVHLIRYLHRHSGKFESAECTVFRRFSEETITRVIREESKNQLLENYDLYFRKMSQTALAFSLKQRQISTDTAVKNQQVDADEIDEKCLCSTFSFEQGQERTMFRCITCESKQEYSDYVQFEASHWKYCQNCIKVCHKNHTTVELTDLSERSSHCVCSTVSDICKIGSDISSHNCLRQVGRCLYQTVFRCLDCSSGSDNPNKYADNGMSSPGKTCVISTVQGAAATNSQKASENAIVEVTVKQEFKGDQRRQRYVEQMLASSLAENIKLDQYPQKSIKIFLQVINNEGNLFSTLYNAAIISLLHNGITMRTTSFAYEFVPATPAQGLALYPVKHEHNLEDDFDTVSVVLDLNSAGVISLTNQRAFDFNEVAKGLQYLVDQIPTTKNLLKSYLHSTFVRSQ